MATDAYSKPTGRRYLTDRGSNIRFLVDTVSVLCVFTRRLVPGRKERTSYDLFAVNGTLIPTYGWHTLTINLGHRRHFTWRFVVADVQIPIIGVDLLGNFSLLVDSRKNRILDGITSLSAADQTAFPRLPSVKSIGSSAPADDTFADFPDLTRPSGVQREVRHNTMHHINTTPGQPVSSRPRRLASDRLAIAKAKFDAMLKDGTARSSDVSWSSALHLFPKKDNVWRSCGDYRALKARTIPDRYPVRHIHEYVHHLAGCTIFSTIDLVRAYHQIPVHPDNVEKTAIAISFGLFEFQFMSFGLRKAAQTFQGFMDEILMGFDFCFAYIDDILVYSRSPEEHERHLRTLFRPLQAYGILLKQGKCVFRGAEVTFLGYRISHKGS